MKNTIISYTNLSLELQKAFRVWLDEKARELISFPFQGKHMKGYIFNHNNDSYVVIMQLHLNSAINSKLEPAERLDINEVI